MGDDTYRARAPAGYLRLRLGGLDIGMRASNYWRSDPAGSGTFDDTDAFERDRYLSLDVKYQATILEWTKTSLRLYADHSDYRQDWPSNAAADCLDGQEAGCLWRLLGHANWAGIEPQVSVDWFNDRAAVTLLGVDARLRNVGSDVNYYDNLSGASPGAVGAFEKNEQSLGAYLQQTLWPTQQVGLNAGVRLDVDSRFGSALSPRTSATLLPWPGGTLKLIYSEAFRAPTAWDVYFVDPRSQVQGGDDLEPEHARSVEASIEQRFDTHHLLFDVFRVNWRDLLLLQDLDQADLDQAVASGELLPDTPNASQIRNVSRIKSFGFDARYGGSLGKGVFHYDLSLSQAFARTTEPGGAPDLLPISWIEARQNARRGRQGGDARGVGFRQRSTPEAKRAAPGPRSARAR